MQCVSPSAQHEHLRGLQQQKSSEQRTLRERESRWEIQFDAVSRRRDALGPVKLMFCVPQMVPWENIAGGGGESPAAED